MELIVHVILAWSGGITKNEHTGDLLPVKILKKCKVKVRILIKKYGPLSEWLTFNISLTLSEKANKRVKE